MSVAAPSGVIFSMPAARKPSRRWGTIVPARTFPSERKARSMKQDSSTKLRAGRRFWLSVLAISLGILGIGELLIRRDTLSLLYSLPSSRLIVVSLVGIVLVGGCLFLI